MSCYIPYKDLETTLYSAYKHDFNKYKELRAVIESVMNLSVPPEAKIHAIWFYSGFINTAAREVESLQTADWKKGVHSSIHNFLQPYLTGEQEFDFDYLVGKINEYFAEPIEVESLTLEDSIMQQIIGVSTAAEIDLVSSVREIITQIQSNKKQLDEAVLDPNVSTSSTLLELLKDQIASRKQTPGVINSIDLINNVLKVNKQQLSQGVTYVDLSNTVGIGIEQGQKIQILRRANGEVFEVIYDPATKQRILHDPTSPANGAVLEEKKGDQIYSVYNKDNDRFVKTDTGQLRMHTDEILSGLVIGDRRNKGSKVTAADELAMDLPTEAGGGFYSSVKIRATVYNQNLNRKRLDRINETFPDIPRQFETTERPGQASLLQNGEGPVLTYIRPVDGFTVTVTNFEGDKSFDVESFTDLAFVYPNNEVVRVDLENEEHVRELKRLLTSDIDTPSWRTDIRDVIYKPATDDVIEKLKISVNRYNAFKAEVQARIDRNIAEGGDGNVNIQDIFYKYYDLTNNVIRTNITDFTAPAESLGTFIANNNGELPVFVQTYDENNNPIGEPQRKKIPIVARKVKGAWTVEDTLAKNEKLVDTKAGGKTYRSVEIYLQEVQGVRLDEYFRTFPNVNAAFVSFRAERDTLVPTVIPMTYQKQAQRIEDVVDIVSGLQYSVGTGELIDWNNKGWGFDVARGTGIRPEIVVLKPNAATKTPGIRFEMLENSNNTPEQIEQFNTYSKANLNIPFNAGTLSEIFGLMNQIYKEAGVTVPSTTTLEEVNRLAKEAIQKLGSSHDLVEKLKVKYAELLTDVKAKFNKAINKHDQDLQEGEISSPLLPKAFKDYGLFDDPTSKTLSLKLFKRGKKENFLDAYRRVPSTDAKKLNLTYRDPGKRIRLPINREVLKKIDISEVEAPVVNKVREVPDPAVITEPLEYIDPNDIATSNSDIPFSIQESLEGFFAISEEQQAAEIAAMKALLPGAFTFTREGFEGLDIDGHALGYVQGLMIHINGTIRAKGTAYHEGFHAVFRRLLSEDQQRFYLHKTQTVLGDYKSDDKGKYIKIGNRKVYADEFRKQRRYLHLNDEQIKHLIYEEYLADSFASYMETNKLPKTWMEKVFAFLKRLLNYFKKGGRIDNLFYDISLGKFRNAPIQEGKQNIETVYSLSYEGVPYIARDINQKPIKVNRVVESFIVSELRDRLIYQMGILKAGRPDVTDSELYDIAVDNILGDYDIQKYVDMLPDRANEIKEVYEEQFQNAKWILGAFGNGVDKFIFSNFTGDSQYSNKVIDPVRDSEQLAKAQATAAKFKQDVLKEFETIDVYQDTEDLDDLLQGENQAEKNDETEIGESFRDVSFVGISPGEGSSGFRKLFKYIPYTYVDPRFGIPFTKMVDSKLIFSTIRKITSTLSKEQIVPRLIQERNRLSLQIDYFNNNLRNKLQQGIQIPDDFSKMMQLRDSIDAVLDTLGRVTGIDSEGNPTKNKHIMNEFMDVFNTVDVRLQQIELISKQEQDGVTQEYDLSDIVIVADINKVRNDFKERIFQVNVPVPQSTAALDALKAARTVLFNENIIQDRFYDNGQINDVKLRAFIDEIYVALSTFNLNIPYSAVSASLAYHFYKASNYNSRIFTETSEYRELLRSNRLLWKNFEQLDAATFFTTTVPNAVSKSMEFATKESRAQSEQLNNLIVRAASSYISGLGEFVLKYDPSIAGSVTRNANGDLVNKYVKPTPAYQTYIKLNSTDDIVEGLDTIIQDYFPGFEEFFANNPLLDTSKAENRVFLEQLGVYAFAGFQQKWRLGDNTIKPVDPTTFGEIDDRSYLLSMLGMFTQMRKVKVPDTGKIITMYPRILTQYEATSTSIVVDGKYVRYFDANGNPLRSSVGTPLYVLELEKAIYQEYDLIRKNFEQHRDNSAPKLYKDYNVNPEKDRGFRFNVLADFFATRPALQETLVEAAKNGTTIQDLMMMDSPILDALGKELEDYGNAQLEIFREYVKDLGITVADLPTLDEVAGIDTPKQLVRDMFFNNWINGIFVNQLFDGPIAVGIKNAATFYKRQKAGAAAGSNLYNPNRGKNYRAAVAKTFTMYIDDLDLTKPASFVPYNSPGNVAVKIFDGQSINTIDRRMRVAEVLGQLDPEAYMLLHRMKFVTESSPEYSRAIEKLRDRGIVFNSLKTVTAAGFQYIKQSEHTLLRKDVSVLKPGILPEQAEFELDLLYSDAEFYMRQLELGNDPLIFDEVSGEDVHYSEMYKQVITRAHAYFQPLRGRELLHNMLNSMEYHRVEQVMDEEASKRATVKPLEYDSLEMSQDGYYFDLSSALEEVPTDMTYIQVETGKIAKSVTQGIQQKLLLISQLDPSDPQYKAIKKDIDQYQLGLAEAVLSQTKWVQRLLETSDATVVGKLYTNIANGLREQGASSAMLQYFELNPDGTARYNPNLAIQSGAITYYFFSLFNKGIFDKKISGRKYYHVSPLGYQIVEKDGKIITMDEQKRNPNKYKNATTRMPSVTKMEDGRMVVEVIVPKELKGIDQKFLEEYLAKKLFFATRIPTEDKRSMMVVKIVDYIDEAYGSSIIVPYQMHMLSGSDFDIDALYAHVHSSYISPDGKKRIAYGDYSYYTENLGMSVDEAKFVEYLVYLSKNDIIKPFLDTEVSKIEQQSGYKEEQAVRFGNYFGGKIGAYFSENANLMEEKPSAESKQLTEDFTRIIATFNVLQTLSNASLPTTPAELKRYGTTPVVDAIFNQILDNKVNILSNPKVFERFFADPRNRADQAVEIYKKLVKSRGMDEAELYNRQNIYTPTALLVARALNAESKDSLGISASFNKGVSMLASIRATLKEPVGLLYLEDGSVIEADRIVDSSVQLVGGGVGMFADAPKNPYPGPLHLNTITTPVMLTMYSVGIPQAAAIMFQSLEPIQNVVLAYTREYGSSYQTNPFTFKKSFNKFLEEQLSQLPKVSKEDYKLIWTGDVSPGSDISNLGFRITDKTGADIVNDTLRQAIILTEFSNYQELANDISFNITKLTDPMKALRPDQDILDKLRNTYKQVKKNTLFTQESIDNLFERYPVLQANEEALDYMDKMSKKVLLERTSFMKGLTGLFRNVRGYTQAEIRNDLKAFIQLQLQRSLIQQGPKGFLPELYAEQLNPEKFMSGDVVADWLYLRNKFPNNTFLAALKPVTEGFRPAIRMLEMSTTKLGATQQDQMYTDILFLLRSPADISERMFRIAYHGMVKSGAQRTRGGFFELIPAALSDTMSKALDKFQAQLIQLDNIVGTTADPALRREAYYQKLNEIVSENFGGKNIENIIEDAIAKIVSTRLIEDSSASYAKLINADKINKQGDFNITQDQIVTFVRTVAPDHHENIIKEDGTRPLLAIPQTRRATPLQIELFTPTGRDLVLDFTNAEEQPSALINATGVRRVSKGVYTFPLYRTNIYGQIMVLTELDGRSLGESFIDTLSESMLNPTTDRLELKGGKAKYVTMGQQGTTKISALAFNNEEGMTVRNTIMGFQQLSSDRQELLPLSFYNNIVRSSNRVYEVRPGNAGPSGQHQNKTYTLMDYSTISTGDTFRKYQYKDGKLYMMKNNVGNGVLVSSELYDRFSQTVGSPSWGEFTNNPKFAGFLSGKETIFVYDLIGGDSQSPSAQPPVDPEINDVIKNKEDESSDCNQ